jgi:hypothetical protein
MQHVNLHRTRDTSLRTRADMSQVLNHLERERKNQRLSGDSKTTI